MPTEAPIVALPRNATSDETLDISIRYVISSFRAISVAGHGNGQELPDGRRIALFSPLEREDFSNTCNNARGPRDLTNAINFFPPLRP